MGAAHRSDGSRAVAALAVAALGADACLAAVAGIGLAGSPPGACVVGPLAIVLGIAAADLVSGIVHWAADTFGDDRTPLVGPALIAPFRSHHRDPEGILRHGFLERNRNAACAMLGPLLFLAVLPPAASLAGWAMRLAALAGALALLATNEIHFWAHARTVPVPIRGLQRVGLWLSPTAHAAHHTGGRRAFCITVGWWNGLLDRLGVLA